jgi:hypothetical protein
MANALYGKFKQELLNKECDLDSDTIKAALTRSAVYTVSINADVGLTAVTTGGAVTATSAGLGSPTIALGVFDTADFTWSAVSGSASGILVLYDDTHASKALIVYYDTGMTGMPVTPNGGDINCTVHASGWFSL